MKSVAMFGYLRDGVGKSSTKAIRNEGKVPCVLYGGSEHIHFSMYAQDFKPLVYTPNTYKVKLEIEGKIYRAILKDIQFHPVNDSIMHADFLEIKEDKLIALPIPVKIEGNSVGVRAGGKLIVKSKKLIIKGLPALFPDFIPVNIDELEIGKSIKVSDITIADGLTILDSPNNPIVSVKTTRAAASAAAAAAAADAKKK
jgi:large subunit ribosomal protein L25